MQTHKANRRTQTRRDRIDTRVDHTPFDIEHPSLAVNDFPARPRPGQTTGPYANPKHSDQPAYSPQNRPATQRPTHEATNRNNE